VAPDAAVIHQSVFQEHCLAVADVGAIVQHGRAKIRPQVPPWRQKEWLAFPE